jgi:3-hydroxymyristoyl/3-hydroxydecanoyl-(acyl carrier protein) dehydratase
VRAPDAAPAPAVYTKADILEIAEGRISAGFGPDFAAVDDFPRRVRVPGEPFTAMSRVTHIEGQRGSFVSGRIVTEFDIPPDAWFAIDGHVASLLALDAQGVLFLLSWLGVDLESRGTRRFRWLDATITMLDDLPRVGETLRFDIRLTSAFRDGESLILTFDMEAGCGGRALLRNETCRVGFFTDAGLATSEGIRPHHRSRRPPSAHAFAAPLPPPAAPPDAGALLALARGDLGVLSPAHASPANPSLRLPPAALLMVDRVLALDPAGGACGLGLIVGERRLDPMHWAIRAHFKDDPVFPGPCMLEGAVQLMKVFALAVGLHAATAGARFELLTARAYRLTFREQVLPAGQMFTYRVDIVGIGLHPAPYLVADVGFEEGGKTIGLLSGIGLRLAADRAAMRRSA